MEMMFYDRPQPDVDSLAPARSALRAFGFAEFLSPIPNRLKSPPGRRNSIRIFLILRMTVRQIQSREFSENWRMILPLLEERAGVRTDVETHLFPLRF
jgi:hypothetical protein